MDFNKMLNGIEAAENEAIKEEQGDYYGEDGLLYCHKCHTPKQVRLEIMGQIRTPRCLCKCAAEQRDREAEEFKREQWERRIQEKRRIGFADSELINCTFALDDKSNPKISAVGLNYVENFKEMRENGKGLLFFGSVGTGKTFIAAAIANALIDKGYNCLVTNFARLVNTIQGMYAGKQEYIDSLNNFDLLIIDDLAAERDTEYMNEIVQMIVDNRYRAGLPLIVTTNLTSEELKNPEDIKKQRTYSRLLEMCIPLEVAGSDRRKDKLKHDYSYYKEKLGL
jgi:DNA replication protein DnaC